MRDQSTLVEELFAAASELTLPERRALLDDRCNGDESLRREVEELLACDDDMPAGYLDPPLPTHGANPGAQVGDVISGRYRLVCEIGEGGMGVVFLAEQTSPVRRRVALKLLKAGLDTREVITRFQAERQALAMMDHPNIARVLDAGASEGGRPFFVMELIEGQSLTAYCDDHRLTPRQRIALFLQVCDAVQHAHTKGVIHRDLKPSNIIVTSRNDKAAPRVIDFGIAKATEQSLAEHTLVTKHGQLVGTPEYMSPEQAMGGSDIDTRTDIYSLGAVLYELLTGQRLFEPAALRHGGISEIERAIHEVEPAKPSSRVQRTTPVGEDNATTSGEGARTRGMSPGSLYKLLRGDLDWIVMRALEKDRARRYETVAALAEDLRRHLASEPVQAGPPSRTYRVVKFVRRNRTLVFSTAVVIAVLVLATAATSVLAVRESAASTRAHLNATAAEQAGARAEAVKLFLEDMLTSARAASSQGANVSMLDVLGATTERIDAGVLADRPDVESEVRRIIGESYLELGWAPLAVPHFYWVVEHCKARNGPRHPSTLDALWDYGESMKESSDAQGATPIFEQFYEGALATLGADDTRTWYALDEIGNALMRTGHARKAMPMHQRAYEELVRLRGEGHHDTALPLFNYGGTLRVLGRYDEAIPIYKRVIEMFDRGPDEQAISAIRARHELGTMYIRSDRYAEADTLLRDTLELATQRLGPEHGEMAAVHQVHAHLAWRRGHMDEAESHFRQFMSLTDKLFESGSLVDIHRSIKFGSLLIAAGKTELAADAFRGAAEDALIADDAVALTEYWPGVLRRDFERAIALRCHAQALIELGRAEEAEPIAREAFEFTMTSFPEHHRDQFESERVLYEAIIAQGRPAEVLDRTRKCLALSTEHDHVIATRTAVTFARGLRALGRETEAALVIENAPTQPEWRRLYGESMLPRVRPHEHGDVQTQSP